jgi:hypothetical protein
MIYCHICTIYSSNVTPLIAENQHPEMFAPSQRHSELLKMPIHDVIPLYPGGNSEHSGDPILRLPGGPLSCYQIQRQITRLQAGFLLPGIYQKLLKPTE